VAKEAAPASSSDLVKFIESHHFGSTLVISHIRSASSGSPCFENTQPFRRELGGRAHVFAHNGDLAEVRSCKDLPLGRRQPMGATDSEYAFRALLDAVEPVWMESQGVPTLDDRVEIVARFSESIRSLGPANFLYWDGDALFAHGHERRPENLGGTWVPGLYTLCRTCSPEPSTPNIEGFALTPAAGDQEVFLVASVPLTDEDWKPLENGELVVASRGTGLRRLEIPIQP
jgi:glutamine amidotransferase